jgi:Ca2+-binding RTX toxin-like protein
MMLTIPPSDDGDDIIIGNGNDTLSGNSGNDTLSVVLVMTYSLAAKGDDEKF